MELNNKNIYKLKDKNDSNILDTYTINLLLKTQFIKNQENKNIVKNSHEKWDSKHYNSKKKITQVKNEIDQYYKKEWDVIKKITNPFEMIYLTNKQFKSYSISLYEPISRSYFKMIEILNLFFKEYKNINKIKKIKSFHLAEGPGGFIEGLLNFRNNNKDLLYGITLISKSNSIPGWNKNNKFLNKKINVNLLTGIDNKGDLYNYKNHLYLIDKFSKNTFDFMTGDGGFDFSVDYNLQEEMAAKLIYSQIILMLALLKKEGGMVCKFFDTYSNITQQLIFILYLQFEEVIIYKPYTSRLANSERYIICKNYSPIPSSILLELINILNIWNKIDSKFNTNKLVVTIKSIINLDENYILNKKFNDFKLKLEKINLQFENKQIDNIKKTINIIKKPQSLKWFKEHSNLQIRTASNWCKKFNVPYKSYIHNLNYKLLYDLV